MPDDVKIKDKISELEKGLYSKEFKPHEIEDTITRKEALSAPSWDSGQDQMLFAEQSARRHNMMKKFVLISIMFFMIAVSVAGFIWWRGSNIVSGELIDVNVLSPLNVAGGEPFETKFTITNNNKVQIDEATLLVEYPTGFYSAEDSSDLPRVSRNLGSILANEAVTEGINTFLYGQENTNKEVIVTLNYRMAGSNATLKKVKTYPVKISSSPVNIKLGIPKEVSSGQEVDLVIDVSSNSKDPTNPLIISATYPSGFSFGSSDPSPSYDNNAWTVAGLNPQEKRTIKIHGIIEGEEGEEKATKISVGTRNPQDQTAVGIIYNATTEATTMVKPVLGIDLSINGVRSQNNVASLGRDVRVEILWQNNNPTKVTDGVVEVRLKGGALDRYSIYASGGGFYRSIDNTIVWDKASNSELNSMDPKARGSLSFSFSPIALGVDAERSIKNPQIIFEVRARAKRISETSAPEDITTYATRSVRFETDLRLTAKSLYTTGPLKNTGPVPPKAEKETTYTIALGVRNSSNNVSDAVVKTTLPIYVKWLNKISPEGENVTYTESSRELVWNVGRIPSGGSRETFFQIVLLPSISQINQVPIIAGETTITGMDDYTRSEVRDKRPPLTTYTSSDPQFSPNDGNVIR